MLESVLRLSPRRLVVVIALAVAATYGIAAAGDRSAAGLDPLQGTTAGIVSNGVVIDQKGPIYQPNGRTWS